MGKRKKREDEEEELEDLLTYFARIPTVTIYGKVYKRIRNHKDTCDGCHAKKGHLHDTACDGEICPYCRGQAVSCPCDPDILNAEKDNYIECKEDYNA